MGLIAELQGLVADQRSTLEKANEAKEGLQRDLLEAEVLLA